MDILESQPEFVFCVTGTGHITYISDRVANGIKSASDDPDYDITHVNQILTPESVEVLYESMNELMSEPMSKNPSSISFVKVGNV